MVKTGREGRYAIISFHNECKKKQKKYGEIFAGFKNITTFALAIGNDLQTVW